MLLPECFVERIKNQLGEESIAFLVSFKQSPSTSIRINPAKLSAFEGGKVSWSDFGFYLSQRPSFGKDPLFHAGGYYVQEASSMVLEPFFKYAKAQFPNQPLRVLDLCAAPGGKSTHLLSLMDKEDVLVANEVIPKRNLVLQEIIVKWGNPNVVVTQNKPEDFKTLPEFFDIILIDAPCSGEGMFRKDAIAIQEWSPAHVETCAVRQGHILESILPSLRVGGFLLYSTCTYNESENDQIIDSLIHNHQMKSIQVPMDEWGQKQTKHGIQMYPHRLKGEGLYMACVQKIAYSKHQSSVNTKPKKTYFRWKEKVDCQLALGYVNIEENHFLLSYNSNIVLINNILLDVIKLIDECLHITYAGVMVGEIKGKNLIPAHELALSCLVNEGVNRLEVNQEEAVRFLRKEDFLQPNTIENGYHLVTFQGQGLGWIKVLPNRANNLYPMNWRIK